MPERLTFQATVVLVAIALGLAFGVAVLLGPPASPAKPSAMREASVDQRARGSAIDLGLTAARAVPALRVDRKDRARSRRPMGVGSGSVTPSLSLVSGPVAPAASARPTPTAVAPVLPAPTPRPRPTPEPTPAATADPAGEFDTTGELDTRGETTTPQVPVPNGASGSTTK